MWILANGRQHGSTVDNVLAYLGIQNGSVSEGTTVEATDVPVRVDCKDTEPDKVLAVEDSDEENSILYASIVTWTEKGTLRELLRELLLIAKPIPNAGKRKKGHRILAQQ